MKVGSTINEAFILYDDFNQKVSGITFSISSYLNGNVYNVPVNISETSPGVYNVNFVPPQTGNWLIEASSISGIIHANYIIDNHDMDEAFPLIEDTYKIQTGKWIMQNNQLILYDGNSSTVLYRFNLYDSNGHPSLTGVTSRVPV